MSRRLVVWGLIVASAGVLLIGLVATKLTEDHRSQTFGHDHHHKKVSHHDRAEQPKDESWELLRAPFAAVVAFGVVTAAGTLAVRARRKS